MVTFEEARQAVSAAWPDYDIAPYGYETNDSWLVLLLPETTGGRVAAVSKSEGSIRWINENDDEYTQQRPVGSRPRRK